jgi:lytic murein transglycosylase
MTARFLAALVVLTCLAAAPADAAQCGGDFDTWLASFQRDAAAKGISQRTISSALSGVTPDPSVLRLDRNQRHFNLSFEEFVARRVGGRVAKGQRMLAQHAGLLSRIEAQYGVPGPVLVAIWGLETDYGANTGKMSAIRSLATLAHDCRRTDRFQAELTDALRIIERGDMSAAEMRGAWAGELGQTQFLPSSYVKFAVDFDGNGRRDLIRSVPDVLASTANYLRGYGWKRGQPWDEGTANFQVLREWNKSGVYAKTVGYFAGKLAGR